MRYIHVVCIEIVHSLLLLKSIPLDNHTIPHVDGHMYCFKFRANKNKAAMNTLV